MSDMKTAIVTTKVSDDSLLDGNINPSTLPSQDDEYDKKIGHKKTAGETLFDRTVYTGIGFGVNEGSAIVIADEFEHGVGKALHSNVRNWMVDSLKFAEKTTKSGKKITAHENAGNTLLTLTLLVSGTALVYPMKWLEDHKQSIVKKFNHKIDAWKGNKLTQDEVVARDSEVEKALACEPKQSWPSLIAGRTTAVVATVGNSMYGMGPARMRQAGNISENLLIKGKLSAAPVMYAAGHKRTRWERYAAVSGVETVCCVISSVVLEFASKFIAKTQKNSPVHNPELCAQVKSEVLPAVPQDAKPDDSSYQRAPDENCIPCNKTISSILNKKSKDEKIRFVDAVNSRAGDTAQFQFKFLTFSFLMTRSDAWITP